MTSQYSRSQLRDVLVEFYSRVDPARLDAGIDINGMIDWIIYHGSDDMNARLQAKYGTGLNFDILNEPKSNQTSAMHRISMMPNTQLMEQQSKRLELRSKVEAFYKENDPEKLAMVDTFVEWIEVNGEKAFNDLLMKKYGKPMGLVTRQKPTPPAPPSGMIAPPPSSSPPPASSTQKAPPSLPPRQATAPSGPEPDLIEKLTRFYALHEPDQPNDPQPIAEWATAVGLTVLNEKLMQLYGGSLDTLDEDERKANEPPPPPPEDDDDDYYPPPPPPEEEEPMSEPEPEPEPEPVMPEPPKPPVITMYEPPKPPAAPVPKFTEPPRKPEPPKLAPAMSAPKAPEPPKFMNKPPTSLPTLPVLKVQAPSAPAYVPKPVVAKPQNIHQAVAVQSSKPAPSNQKQRKRRPSEGACDHYVLDLSGDGFGVCVCGFNRAAHTQPKVNGSDRRSIKVKAPSTKSDKPCSNYRVDVSGKNFGDCTCGWGKTDHTRIDLFHPGMEIKSPISPKGSAVPHSHPVEIVHNPNDIVEMMFDQATTTVFNMMVESYVEQHGEEPDSDTKVDWASNLAILSAGKDATNGTKLKIRAKALPKKKN